ncbi:hypothetical protein E6W39_29030 [Kitasatospora acidiphila]|uniref:Uncharacterized protein n=1 Tax=Kitasatospora acidiphila TaxID=2567942 RepID=A0A540W957_9ACTN|nr:hypothetical protein [Kitasatospora acidiphila]TQF05532.1 hypothetical protein E6W39_29030 [Kitasatospora acidiphila]
MAVESSGPLKDPIDGLASPRGGGHQAEVCLCLPTARRVEPQPALSGVVSSSEIAEPITTRVNEFIGELNGREQVSKLENADLSWALADDFHAADLGGQ